MFVSLVIKPKSSYYKIVHFEVFLWFMLLPAYFRLASREMCMHTSWLSLCFLWARERKWRARESFWLGKLHFWQNWNLFVDDFMPIESIRIFFGAMLAIYFAVVRLAKFVISVFRWKQKCFHSKWQFVFSFYCIESMRVHFPDDIIIVVALFYIQSIFWLWPWFRIEIWLRLSWTRIERLLNLFPNFCTV